MCVSVLEGHEMDRRLNLERRVLKGAEEADKEVNGSMEGQETGDWDGFADVFHFTSISALH